MKKIFLFGGSLLLIAILAITSYAEKHNQTDALFLANLEALTSGEGGSSSSWACWSASKSGSSEFWLCGNPCALTQGRPRGSQSTCRGN